MSFQEAIDRLNIVLDESIHYSVVRSDSNSNMFTLTIVVEDGKYNISLPVHITHIGDSLRTLARCGCIADCVKY